jgi:hypothetical protein
VLFARNLNISPQSAGNSHNGGQGNIQLVSYNVVVIEFVLLQDKAGQKYRGLLDKTQTSVTLDADGSARFPASASGTQVWVPV